MPKNDRNKITPTVTAYVSTRNRYHSTLPACLLGIATQTVAPKMVILFDDGDHRDLRNVPIYRNIFAMMSSRGIEWHVFFTEGKGQVPNHQRALELADTEWIWRLDDDNVAEKDALEKMLAVADKETGAVGGLVLHPTHMDNADGLASSEIADVMLGLNVQWWKFTGIKEVDHLYSTFIYRKEAGRHGYCMELSPVGHHEETIFTYQMKRDGWKLKVTPEAVTWHLREATGGIRTYNDPTLWEGDKIVFRRKLSEWGVKLNNHFFIVLDNGLGDHYAFRNILPEIRKQHKEDKIILAVCYKEVFEEEKDLNFIGIGHAKSYFGNLDRYNIYKWMWDNNWQGSIVDAFRKLYGVTK